jgi:hypothetical protein
MPPGAIIQEMAKRKKPPKAGGFLEAYKRIRKPMPPPEKVIGDKRRALEEEQTRREIEEGESGRGGSSEET